MNAKKITKIFAASGLALFMGVGTLLGVLVEPVANSASAQLGDSTLTPQEKLLAGTGLGLDPENDPVVFTTDWGLEIKYANALTNSNLAGYTYFTMGKYNNYDVNWVIIGYDPSMRAYVGEYSGYTYQRNPIQGNNTVSSTIDESPAGKAILKENFVISSLAKPNEEIGDGCVLCFSECCLGYSDTAVLYSQSNLCKKIDAMYEYSSTYPDYYLNFSSDFKKAIQLKTLKNGYYYYTFETVDKYMFTPSIYVAESTNFSVVSYMSDYTPRIAYQINTTTACDYWCKDSDQGTSNRGVKCDVNGDHISPVVLSNQLGVRPAFVLKI